MYLMSITRASGCRGTPPPPELMDTSLSTSLRVWICHYEAINYISKTHLENFCIYFVFLYFSGSDESFEVLVGDVTSHQLLNLKPGTTYDLKVLAQYNTGLSDPLIGQGTTCKLVI